MSKPLEADLIIFDHRYIPRVALSDSTREPVLSEATYGGYHYQVIENHPDGDRDTSRVIDIDNVTWEGRVQVNFNYYGDPLDENEEQNPGFKVVYEDGVLTDVFFSVSSLAGSLPSVTAEQIPAVIELYDHFYVTDSDVKIGIFGKQNLLVLFPIDTGALTERKDYDFTEGNVGQFAWEINGKPGVNFYLRSGVDAVEAYFEDGAGAIKGRRFPRYKDASTLKGRMDHRRIIDWTRNIGELISANGK